MSHPSRLVRNEREQPRLLFTVLTLSSSSSSDADSDVLADYVLALLRHDSPQAELRKLCIEQLEDFLKERMCSRGVFGTVHLD